MAFLTEIGQVAQVMFSIEKDAVARGASAETVCASLVDPDERTTDNPPIPTMAMVAIAMILFFMVLLRIQ
ncbi:hypothetical protein HJO_06630 [Hyphomonas johnsonii MHS-2]|uniref:Uncharacterized protein n=1 Tax=Hyphomonas johnsonii MHS-2 TaxID=1280950 RepID=A0A059FS78_9PROT|nr:hypothetical protein HJO_06630 [Hyphomonas johnsonii MHS-2]